MTALPMVSPDPMERRSTMQPAARACHAKTRDGTLCENPAISGATVCRKHGGNAPAVRRKAQLRLIELVDPALAKHAHILETSNDERVVLKAIEMIYDRTGLGKQQGDDLELAKALLLERLLAIQQRDTIDGEIVDESTD